MAFYRAERDALDRVNRAVDEIRKTQTPKARARLGKAGQSYLDAHDALASQYSLVRESMAATGRRVSLREVVEEMARQDRDKTLIQC